MTMCSVRKKLNPEDRKFCFQLFGYDYMLDSEFKVWLIEVNCNPCIETTSPYLEKLIPRMLDDALKLTVDQIFPRKVVKIYNHQVDGSSKPPGETGKSEQE